MPSPPGKTRVNPEEAFVTYIFVYSAIPGWILYSAYYVYDTFPGWIIPHVNNKYLV